MDDIELKFDQNLNHFINKISALHEVLPVFKVVLIASNSLARNNKGKFLEENGELVEDNPNFKKYRINDMNVRKIERMDKSIERIKIASDIIPDKFLISYVSDYDAFLGGLIRELLSNKPSIIDSNERTISFSKLKTLGTIDNAFEHIISKEIETVLRKSHQDQFKWLENICDVKLTKGLDSWSNFIELTERRNLLVHTDGIISSHYIDNCKFVNSDISNKYSVGDKINVSQEYLNQSYRCLYEISVKLTQVIWRKVFPNDILNADHNLINITFDLLHDSQYELAQELLSFGVKVLKNHSNDAVRRTLVINYAQSFYHDGSKDECSKILDNEDWSSCSDNFRLCNEVLRENFDECVNLMLNIGDDGSINEADYLDWPVFKEFRTSEKFVTTFERIFGKDPNIQTETVDQTKLDDINNDLRSLLDKLMNI